MSNEIQECGLTQEVEQALELQMMKEKLSKLLLGEDMSGIGNGKGHVCTAQAISNSMTNLYANVFGQFKKLEPISQKQAMLWKREKNWLLSSCDYMVDQYGKPRSDIANNIPGLKKLDALLLEILNGFTNNEFEYKDKSNLESDIRSPPLGLFKQRYEDKWWLPMPCLSRFGLSENCRRILIKRRESANQIHKAVKAINNEVLAEIEIPEAYIATLPKCGKQLVGEAVHRYMSTASQSDFLDVEVLKYLDIKSEHEALDIADKMEASMCIWKRKNENSSKSSWMGVVDAKNENLAIRAKSVLSALKGRYPTLSQTTLDSYKIENNKDVGHAILESYSRVLESLAFNIAARIEDVLYIDESVKNEFDMEMKKVVAEEMKEIEQRLMENKIHEACVGKQIRESYWEE